MNKEEIRKKLKDEIYLEKAINKLATLLMPIIIKED
jgi:hypothetical protein